MKNNFFIFEPHRGWRGGGGAKKPLNARSSLKGSQNGMFISTVKLVLSGHSKIDKSQVLMANGSLMMFKNLGAFSDTFGLH